MESSIRLVVKTPNQRFKDIHIDCDLGWTVKKLKEYLANVHPTNPESLSQRLIYSGHLLKDEQQLKEILSKEHDSHTVHIVCPNSSEDASKEMQTKGQPATSNENYLSSSSLPASDGIRRRNVPNSMQYPGIGGHMQWQGASNHYNAYWQSYYAMMMQQYQAMYQGPRQSPESTADHFYQWQQNMMAMHQQSISGYPYAGMPAHFSSPVAPPSEPSSPASQSGGSVADGPPVAAPMEPPQAAVGPLEQGQNDDQRNQNMPMNAGGAMFDEDDENGEERRDWLDWIHTFLRASVMISIMYFYSSTVRILMISLLGFIIYLYQAGWLTLRRQRPDEVENVNQNENENGQARQQEVDGGNRGDENGEQIDAMDDRTDEDRVDITEQQIRISPFRAQMRVIYTFVTSFFVSLVPQGAQ